MGSSGSREQNVENMTPPQRREVSPRRVERNLQNNAPVQRTEERLQQLQERQKQQNPDIKEKCYNPNDPDLKFTDKEDEHDFLCEGFSSRRALMSCGHSVTPPSLFYWCKIQLDQGNTSFKCGVCKAVWPFEEVTKMALLTEEEKDDFEEALFRIIAHKNLKIQQCPGCKCRVMREDPSNLRVRCPQCSAKKGRRYEFCWQCKKEWKSPSVQDSNRCGNEGCENPDLRILKTCPEIEFENVRGVTGCPSIRACPTCGKLIAHNREKCKNITCPDCEVEFCFVCLKITTECLKTSSHFRPCSSGVAPRQTSIPVRRK